jgi:hypothetical protein
MKFTKIFGRLVLGVIAVAVLLYLIALAVNWKDRPPSAAAMRLEKLIAERPQVPASDNVVVYMLGFTAPAEADPNEVGARRLAWTETYNRETKPDSDPLPQPISFVSMGSRSVAQLRDVCSEDDRKPCADAFADRANDWQPTEIDALALRRYETLLARRGWRDVVPFDISAPIPPYADVLHGQRLHLLRLMQLAEQGRVEEVRAGLSADFDFWRAAQPRTEILIGKMIAVAALRNHFFFTNLIVRRLPAGQVMNAIPADWERGFTDDERSMLLVMAGEIAWARGTFTQLKDGTMPLDDPENLFEPRFSGRWFSALARPLFQVQDSVNLNADRYVEMCQQFEAPLSEYPRVAKLLNDKRRDAKRSLSLYNLAAELFLGEDDGTQYLDYPMRVASLEGMRRAALLVAQLHARGVAADALPAELDQAALRDPYTNSAFEWDPKRGSVIFNGPENHKWRRQEYFY